MSKADKKNQTSANDATDVFLPSFWLTWKLLYNFK